MSEIAVPRQQDGQEPHEVGRPPVAPGATEACRLLCVGTYVDTGYRDAVLDELYVHEERFPAPSAGVDAARVLAHAVRARRAELGWASALVALWIVAGAASVLLGLYLWLSCVAVAIAPWIRGRSATPPFYRRVLAFWCRWWWGVAAFVGVVCALVFAVFRGSDDGSAGADGFGAEPTQSFWDTGVLLPSQGFAALALICLVLMAVTVGARRDRFAKYATNELSRARFPSVGSDPAERSPNERLHWLSARLRAEQHAPLAMYRSTAPFRGYGEPFRTWNLAVELKPRENHAPRPVDNAEVLRRIRPLVESLRVPSPRASVRAADVVRDRLRELVVDECVFLPADGMTRRDGAPYDAVSFEGHRAASVEEGGESRRHFLRIRVGGWHEEVVVTVFVRVHTQGGMLVLEFAPHVLLPVRQDFSEGERQALRFRANTGLGKAAWACAHTPGAPPLAVYTLVRSAVTAWRRITAGYGRGLPEGPGVAVRELGSGTELSLFQEMDVQRYVRSIEDRVADGVRGALYEAGYRTVEFEQKIVNIAGGGVLIESVTGSAIGVGDHNTIGNRNEKAGERDDRS